MQLPKRIIFVRHAESEANATKDKHHMSELGKKTYEFDLTDKGIDQAHELGKYLGKYYEPFDHVRCSNATRARETLEYMSTYMRDLPKPHYDNLMLEVHRGALHAFNPDEYRHFYPEEPERFAREGHLLYAPPGGENWIQLELRVRQVFTELCLWHGGQNILLVGHGQWGLMFMAYMEKWPLAAFAEYLKGHKDLNIVPNTGIMEFGKHKDSFFKGEIILPW